MGRGMYYIINLVYARFFLHRKCDGVWPNRLPYENYMLQKKLIKKNIDLNWNNELKINVIACDNR